jgi:hypothetical protein
MTAMTSTHFPNVNLHRHQHRSENTSALALLRRAHVEPPCRGSVYPVPQTTTRGPHYVHMTGACSYVYCLYIDSYGPLGTSIDVGLIGLIQAYLRVASFASALVISTFVPRTLSVSTLQALCDEKPKFSTRTPLTVQRIAHQT